MTQFAVSEKIHASPEEVFKFLTTIANINLITSNNIRVTHISSPIARVGQRAKWTVKKSDNTTTSWDELYTRVDENRVLQFEKWGARDSMRGGYYLFPSFDGTLLVYEKILDPASNPDKQIKGLQNKLKRIKEQIEKKSSED
ncbi:MAG: SRPBCC family protein [Candidatus Ranarchaeia archaeon]|jgi:hypothetical protein